MSTEQEKIDRFKKIATNRTNKILKDIQLLGNCSNKSNYEYTDEDVKKIFSAIDEELKAVKVKFKSKKERTNFLYKIKGGL